SMGRFGSVITALREPADSPVTEELCLGKAGKNCTACIDRCPTGALKIDGFDRKACYAVCLKAEKELGADVCGKCTVAVPCAVKENNR
ncbi:MAG: hypothetical protein IJB12_05070, partial [Methanocorpusculum sp.]|nr:hypothetical protein [Methanocorpusculum sp.]